MESLELEWHDSIFKGRFHVRPCKSEETYRVNYPTLVLGVRTQFRAAIKLKCLPVVLNHATTGHKLQGKSMDEIVITEWSKKDAKKWAYVMISRVRTLEGLFLLEPLPDNIDFQPDEKYLQMMARLRGTILACPEQVADLMECFPSSPYYELCLQAQEQQGN